MTEKMSLVLRALVYQADKHPGISATGHLSRGLELEVTKSTETPNYKLRCGRKRGYPSELELTIVAANWPQVTQVMEWQQTMNADEGGINWYRTIVKPVLQEATQEAR